MCTENSSADCKCPLCAVLNAFDNHPMGKHLRAAQREFLVAIRSVLDSRIESLKDEPEAGPQKVNVE